MSNSNEVQNSVNIFLSMLKHVPSINWDVISIDQAKDKYFLKKKIWCNSPGIYLFYRQGQIKYIGRATPTTGLKNRIYEQSTAIGDPIWDDVINDSSSSVSIIYFQPEDWYWVASLEVFLIEKYRPYLVNKRKS